MKPFTSSQCYSRRGEAGIHAPCGSRIAMVDTPETARKHRARYSSVSIWQTGRAVTKAAAILERPATRAGKKEHRHAGYRF